MKLIVCVDNRNGLRFNHRRQSRDRAVCEKILERCEGAVLRMNADSAKLFEKAPPGRLTVSENFLEQAEAGDYCFCEDTAVQPYLQSAEQLWLFHWNRTYPSDRKLKLDGLPMKLLSSEEFPGHSHEKLTLEVFALVH